LTRATPGDLQRIQAWRKKAVIYSSDETGINNQDQIGKTYAPRRQKSVLAQTGQKFSMSMIVAVSNRDLTRLRRIVSRRSSRVPLL
jgi:phage FluMu protein gp41